MDEPGLIRRCQAGDVKAFEPLFRAHVAMAVRTAYLVVRDWPIAEDAAQEAFVRAFGSIRSFRADQPFAPWLYRIVLNEARRIAARAGRRPEALQLPDELLASEESTPEEAALHRERRAALWTAIDSLKDDHRTVLVLKYFNQFSEIDIATVLGVPQSTVKSRLYKAREKLLERLGHREEVLP